MPLLSLRKWGLTLMIIKEHWNNSHGNVSNDLVSGIVVYIILPIFLKPLFIALLAGGTAWLSTQWVELFVSQSFIGFIDYLLIF